MWQRMEKFYFIQQIYRMMRELPLPSCGDILEEDTVYCDCGQRLDWGDEE